MGSTTKLATPASHLFSMEWNGRMDGRPNRNGMEWGGEWNGMEWDEAPATEAVDFDRGRVAMFDDGCVESAR